MKTYTKLTAILASLTLLTGCGALNNAAQPVADNASKAESSAASGNDADKPDCCKTDSEVPDCCGGADTSDCCKDGSSAAESTAAEVPVDTSAADAESFQ